MLIHASVRSGMVTPSAPSPAAHSSGYRAMPFPLCWLCRAPSLPASLTCVPVTYAARSLAVRPSLIAVRRAAEPAISAGTHVTWRLRSSPAEPMAPMSMVGAGGARAPLLITGSHPNDRNQLAPAFPTLCCKCMFQVFRMFQRYVAIGIYGCCKCRSGCCTCCIFFQAFSGYVASV
jgi:hypothetical protein